MGTEAQAIVVKGAREHNLRNVSLTLPRNKLICFTGVSGSGKSSLAFDTLFAEGQRRYIESLSSYARQFLGQVAKPDVDLITGLSPAISIQQKTSGWNPRSTVGTITQIHDYLRVLFARIGRQHCTQCGRPISAQTRDQIVGRILALGDGRAVTVLAPVVRGQKGEYRDLFEDMLKRGHTRARVNGQIMRLTDDPKLEKNKKHHIEIVVDRLTLADKSRGRLAESVDAALTLGEGTLIVTLEAVQGSSLAEGGERGRGGEGGGRRTAARVRRGVTARPLDADLLMSSRYACAECGISYQPPTPQMFSFNSPSGMCLTCDGLGTRFDFDNELLVPNPRRSFLGLAIEPMRTKIGRWRRHIYEAVARHVGFDLKTPWKDLPKKARDALLYGLGETHLTFEWRWSRGVWRHGGKFEGVVAELHEKHRKARSNFVRAYYEKYMRQTVCPDCKGARLNAQALAVKLGRLNLQEVSALAIADATAYFADLDLNPVEMIIAEEVLKEIRGRLGFLHDVGLHYLTLDRTAPTLSGGESQRIRLASQIGSGLVGVLYVLDEPSIGLHSRDNRRLLDSLERLRDMGNTVIVVEHDEETMRTADLIVDFGPGPGVRGGEVVAVGDVRKLSKTKDSVTGAYLAGKASIEVPKQRRPVTTRTAGSKSAQTRQGERRRIRALKGPVVTAQGNALWVKREKRSKPENSELAAEQNL